MHTLAKYTGRTHSVWYRVAIARPFWGVRKTGFRTGIKAIVSLCGSPSPVYLGFAESRAVTSCVPTASCYLSVGMLYIQIQKPFLGYTYPMPTADAKTKTWWKQTIPYRTIYPGYRTGVGCIAGYVVGRGNASVCDTEKAGSQSNIMQQSRTIQAHVRASLRAGRCLAQLPMYFATADYWASCWVLTKRRSFVLLLLPSKKAATAGERCRAPRASTGGTTLARHQAWDREERFQTLSAYNPVLRRVCSTPAYQKQKKIAPSLRGTQMRVGVLCSVIPQKKVRDTGK